MQSDTVHYLWLSCWLIPNALYPIWNPECIIVNIGDGNGLVFMFHFDGWLIVCNFHVAGTCPLFYIPKPRIRRRNSGTEGGVYPLMTPSSCSYMYILDFIVPTLNCFTVLYITIYHRIFLSMDGRILIMMLTIVTKTMPQIYLMPKRTSKKQEIAYDWSSWLCLWPIGDHLCFGVIV